MRVACWGGKENRATRGEWASQQPPATVGLVISIGSGEKVPLRLTRFGVFSPAPRPTQTSPAGPGSGDGSGESCAARN